MIRIGFVLLAASACLLATEQTSKADDARFVDLLARARAEAAAGHNVGPPGDNLSETFMAMINILPSATPQQLAEFDELLQQQRAALLPQDDEKPAAVAADSDQPVRAAPSVPAGAKTMAARAPVENATLNAAAAAPEPRGAPDPVPAAGIAAAAPTLPAHFLARGKAAEAAGDISGARRYYEAAAEENSSAAAQALAQLFDPAYLRQKAVGGIDPDPAAAQRWYQRARTLTASQQPTHNNTVSAR